MAPVVGPEPIAIIGMGCRLPGGADSPDKLWRLLEQDQNTWTDVPPDRYNWKAFHHPHQDSQESHNHRGGHFIKQDISAFDASFFGIAASEANAMDPQQRILLETTYEALESTGIPLGSIRGSDTAVFTATFNHDYENMLLKDTQDLPKYHLTGNASSIISNRISYVFDLKGASMSLDTACSGGLVAIHQACQTLRAGESSMAIVGGSNLILTPDFMYGMSFMGMLNSEGRSFPFDERGNGYGRGEGVASLVLKRLGDALAAGDPIRAVIRNTGVNQDGKTNGITLPSSQSQEILARHVHKQAGLEPAHTAYVEAHGTGTVAGDRAEVEAIRNVFCRNRESELLIGSIKGNVGHLEPTSGLAAVIKVVLALEKGLLPATPDVSTLKASLSLHNISIPRHKPVLWPSGMIRRASVNNFGFGGTNAHVILEEAGNFTNAIRDGSDSARSEPFGDTDAGNMERYRLFVLTAKSSLSLVSGAQELRSWALDHQDDFQIDDLAHTLVKRGMLMNYRLGCVASNKEELISSLLEVRPTKSSQRETPVVFLFTGQGAQWFAMGRDLITTQSEFRSSILKSDQILSSMGITWSLVDELQKEKHLSQVDKSDVAQSASLAVQIALVDLMHSLGVFPDAVLGHSSGEMGAAYAAGVLSHEQALMLSDRRSLISSWCDEEVQSKGAMLAAGLGEEDIVPYIELIPEEYGIVKVACVNSRVSTTISGDRPAIEAPKQILDSESIFARVLNVDTAYHSHHMKIVAPRYRQNIGSMAVSTLHQGVRYFSTVTAQEKLSDFGTEYWVENLISKVRFSEGLETLCKTLSQQHNGQMSPIFIELGPHPALAGPTRQVVTDLNSGSCKFDYTYTSALVRGQGARRTVLDMAGKIFQHAAKIDLTAVNRITIPTASQTQPHGNEQPFVVPKPAVLTGLPSYSWDHTKKYWHESRLSLDYRLRSHPHHDLSGLRMVSGSSTDPAWRNLLNTDRMPWLLDHLVDDFAIFPGSAYMCMAVEAVWQLALDSGRSATVKAFKLRDVRLTKALVIPEAPSTVEVQLILHTTANARGTNNGWRDFVVTALSPQGQWAEHCRGWIMVELGEESDDGENNAFENNTSYEADKAKWRESLNDKCTLGVSQTALYEGMRENGNHYGDLFANITEFRHGDHVAQARIVIPNVAGRMPGEYAQPHHIHPTTLDTIAHAALPLYARYYKAGSIMPVRFGELTITANMPNQQGHELVAAVELVPLSKYSATVNTSVFNGAGAGFASPCVTISGMELMVMGESKPPIKSQKRNLSPLHIDWSQHDDRLASASREKAVEEQPDRAPPLPLPQLPIQILTLSHKVVHLAEELCEALRGTHISSCVAEFHHDQPFDWEKKAYVVFDDASHPFLLNPQPALFSALAVFLSKARSVLWVSMAAASGCMPGPDMNLVDGFTRVARRENEGMRLLTFGVAQAYQESERPDIWRVIDKILSTHAHQTTDMDPSSLHECEFVYRQNKIWVPRLRAAPDYEAWLRVRDGDHEPPAKTTKWLHDGPDHVIALDIASPGLLSSLRFIHVEDREPIGGFQVEIQARSLYLTPTDVFIGGGGADARLSQTSPVAGIITAVGSQVQHRWKVGERVTGFTGNVLSNYPRLNASLVHRLPPSVDFAGGVSSLHAFVTAHYALSKVASLRRQQTVLIHAADRECGQAAIMLASHIGAEVFATVNDNHGRQVLVDLYHIPPDHILPLRSEGLRQHVMRLTGGRGVDVALNFAGHDVLDETWAIISDLGILVDMPQPNNTVPSIRWDKNGTFLSFDLGSMIKHQPSQVGELIVEAMAMFRSGIFRLVFPVPRRNISDLVDAFQQIQTGKTSHATLIEVDNDSIVEAAPPRLNTTPRLAKHGTYIIAGGLGDLGQEICQLLATRGAKHVVVLSRSGKSKSAEKWTLVEGRLAMMETRVHVLKCDVTVPGQVESVAKWCREHLPPVRGLIQSAAILQDRMLEWMDIDTFNIALRPKRDGTLNLKDTFMSEPLDFFIMLASAISVLGTKGQANYAAGNTFQEGLAAQNRGHKTHFVAINPGLVQGTDADLYSPERRNILARQGLSTVALDDVLSAIDYSMTQEAHSDQCTQLIVGLDPKLLVAHNASVNNLIFHDILHEHDAGVEVVGGIPPPPRTLDQSISTARSREELLNIVTDAIASKLSELAGIERGDVSVHVPIAGFGLDSLVAIEVKNWISRVLKARMQTSDVLDAPSLTALAATALSGSSIVHSTSKV
ncbi:hypothetical protein GGS20DRAFT_599281 [Poronia punctata]|nr:hypothetical protein GGS20DRAFT_599281 [Poronia punctata]